MIWRLPAKDVSHSSKSASSPLTNRQWRGAAALGPGLSYTPAAAITTQQHLRHEQRHELEIVVLSWWTVSCGNGEAAAQGFRGI